MKRNFYEWIIFLEGQAEDQTLKLVQGNTQLLQQIKQISPEPKYMPVIAYFHINERIPLQQLQQEIGKYKEHVNKKRIPMLQITKKGALLGNENVNWLGFTEKLHAIEGKIAFKNRDNTNDGQPVKGKPIFSKNNIDVYEAHGRDKCIQYGQGYSFCISQPANTMWQSYRDSQASTFYFVFDRNRGKDDPLHVVVVDHTNNGWSLTDGNNTTGTIAEFGGDSEAYLKHLESKGIPTSIFKHIEHSDQEKSDIEKFRFIDTLEEFKELTHEEKSRFIGRGYNINFEKFSYLYNNKLDDLIHQTLTTGIPADKEILELIKDNKNLMKSYIRSRKIATEQEGNLEPYEISYLDKDSIKEVVKKVSKSKNLNLKAHYVQHFNDEQKRNFLSDIEYEADEDDFFPVNFDIIATMPIDMQVKVCEKMSEPYFNSYIRSLFRSISSYYQLIISLGKKFNITKTISRSNYREIYDLINNQKISFDDLFGIKKADDFIRSLITINQLDRNKEFMIEFIEKYGKKLKQFGRTSKAVENFIEKNALYDLYKKVDLY